VVSNPWIAGGVQELVQESGCGNRPGALVEQSALAAPWTHIIVTGAGVALGVSGYTPTAEPLPLVICVRRLAIRRWAAPPCWRTDPSRFVNVYDLISQEQWQALAVSA